MSETTEDQNTELQALADSEEYEEINSDEVDRVVEALDHLMEIVQSENIKHYLEEAASSIYYLVYEDESEGQETLDKAA